MDGLLGDAILEVGIDPAEGELLLLRFTCRAKLVVCEAAVVAVGGKAFKSKLGIKGLK